MSGRWSLVDEFNSAGRRFLVVRKNAPRVPDPRALTEREQQVVRYRALGNVNKQIAYALGLSEATVATHVRRAMVKLAVRTQVELVELVQRMAGEFAQGS